MSTSKNTVLDIDHGWEEMLKETKLLDKGYVLVGIQQGAKRDPPPAPEGAKEPKADTKTFPTMAEIAYWNEFGTENKDGTQKTPPRPFMRKAVDDNKSIIDNRRDKLMWQILTGKLTTRQGLDQLGLMMMGLIQKSIIDLRDPPNAESTIAQKGSSNPLIDSSQMMRSIKHVVKMKGK